MEERKWCSWINIYGTTITAISTSQHQSSPTSHTLLYNMNYPMVTFNQNTQLGYGQYSNNLSSQQATYQHFCDSMLPAVGHTSTMVSEYHENADSLLSYELNARNSYESDENIHTGGKLTQRKSPKAKNRFPHKLYRMLELASAQFFGYSSYSVSWLSHGQAFKILDEDRFMMYIVPSFFKQVMSPIIDKCYFYIMSNVMLLTPRNIFSSRHKSVLSTDSSRCGVSRG